MAARAAARELLSGLPIGLRNSPFRDPVERWRVGRGEGVPLEVAYRAHDGEAVAFTVTVAGDALAARLVGHDGPAVAIEVDGHRRSLRLTRRGERVHAHVDGYDVVLERVPRFPHAEASDRAGGCRAPMTGKVLALLVAAGDAVVAGQPLVTLEAMKMEHTLEAPRDGEVAEMLVGIGDIVEADQELVRLSLLG